MATVTLNTDTGAPGELRTAIQNATSGEIIDFSLSSGSETIVLDASLGELVIAQSLTIDGINFLGSGTQVTIDAGGNSRVMNIDDGNGVPDVGVTLDNITITGGVESEGGGIRNTESLLIRQSQITGNSAMAGPGGGVYSTDQGVLAIEGSTVEFNYAATTTNLSGGGIAVAASSLYINDSVIANNTATGTPGTYFGGGGIAGISYANGTYAANDVVITDSQITGNTITGDQDPNYPYNGVNPYGGGIYVRGYGDVAITNSHVSGNAAIGTGDNQAVGGGLKFYNDSYALNVTVTDTEIANNYSSARGGGLQASVYANSTGTIDVDVMGTTISSNTSVTYGGGFYQYGYDQRVQTTITDSTISGNTSGSAGGIANWNGYLRLESSTVDSNVSVNTTGFQYGGGISNYGLFLNYAGALPPLTIIANSTVSGNSTTGRGGGIYSYNGFLQVIQSTLSGNIADTEGGGVFMYSNYANAGTANEGYARIERSTITENSAGGVAGYGGGGLYVAYYHTVLTIADSIVAGNLAPSTGVDIFDYSANGAVASNTTFTLVGDNADSGLAEANPGPDANGNIVGGTAGGIADPMLAGLADNGGPTLTHLPSMTSLAGGCSGL